MRSRPDALPTFRCRDDFLTTTERHERDDIKQLFFDNLNVKRLHEADNLIDAVYETSKQLSRERKSGPLNVPWEKKFNDAAEAWHGTQWEELKCKTPTPRGKEMTPYVDCILIAKKVTMS